MLKFATQACQCTASILVGESGAPAPVNSSSPPTHHGAGPAFQARRLQDILPNLNRLRSTPPPAPPDVPPRFGERQESPPPPRSSPLLCTLRPPPGRVWATRLFWLTWLALGFDVGTNLPTPHTLYFSYLNASATEGPAIGIGWGLSPNPNPKCSR